MKKTKNYLKEILKANAIIDLNSKFNITYNGFKSIYALDNHITRLEIETIDEILNNKNIENLQFIHKTLSNYIQEHINKSKALYEDIIIHPYLIINDQNLQRVLISNLDQERLIYTSVFSEIQLSVSS